MPAAPLPSDEQYRLEKLHEYQILDTLPEQEYNDIVTIASQIFGTPIALISLVDEDRQWFKAKVGVDVVQTDRELAFCAHAILQPTTVLAVENALEDPRFADNALVLDAPHIRFYAGAPLVTPEGAALGTLCVIDSQPHEISAEQRTTLEALARQVVALLQLRKKTHLLEVAQQELERSNRDLSEFTYVVSHDLKEPLRGIRHLSSFFMEDHGDQLNSDGIDQINKIVRLAERMNDLITTLLHHARLGNAQLNREQIDLASIIHSVKETLGSRIVEGNVEIKHNDSLPVTGDRIRLEEVLQNLIANAIKYNDSDKKRVEIGSQTVADGTQSLTAYFVADNGIGIDRRHFDSVFTIFRRLHGREEYGGGTGAGLTIVNRIIGLHGGAIWIDEQYRDGTCFWISFKPMPPEDRKRFAYVSPDNDAE